jgi:hypothetical protein
MAAMLTVSRDGSKCHGGETGAIRRAFDSTGTVVLNATGPRGYRECDRDLLRPHRATRYVVKIASKVKGRRSQRCLLPVGTTCPSHRLANSMALVVKISWAWYEAKHLRNE